MESQRRWGCPGSEIAGAEGSRSCAVDELTPPGGRNEDGGSPGSVFAVTCVERGGSGRDKGLLLPLGLGIP
ncbi:hypothetical protein MLD38_032189 [Melastoma candidum]|uniref:Uncharacterized protein n=1 Tax=Melastoma candidum TaxID=119954 RepID=A0ACB9M4P8_9MYRT|nr:hypothetical protein MLD38_032189 [Melastoma candidum]